MDDMRDPRKTFGEALLEAAQNNERIVALSADSSSGSGMTPFKETFPQRHFEFGIMEQGIMGFASGLATTGKIPFFAAIAPFVTARPFEMFRNDLGYMNQNVKVVGRSAGLTYSDLGPTHQSLDDIAITRTIPGVTVINPGDPVDIVKAVHAAVAHIGPVYIKIGSPKMPVFMPQDYPFEIGKGVVMEDGKDVAIIATGTLLSKAVAAANTLKARGIAARLINMHTIKPLDRELVLKAAEETGKIVTVEEGYLAGGLGGCIAELLASERPTPMKMLGVNDQYAATGPYEELLSHLGLQGEQIADTVEQFLKSPG
jgi:transketolase